MTHLGPAADHVSHRSGVSLGYAGEITDLRSTVQGRKRYLCRFWCFEPCPFSCLCFCLPCPFFKALRTRETTRKIGKTRGKQTRIRRHPLGGLWRARLSSQRSRQELGQNKGIHEFAIRDLPTNRSQWVLEWQTPETLEKPENTIFVLLSGNRLPERRIMHVS